jgi:putative serine protease PepD
MTSQNAPAPDEGRGTGRPGIWKRPKTVLIAACAACAVVGGVIGGVIANAINSPASTTNTAATTPVTGDNTSTGGKQPSAAVCQVTQVAKEVLPSVVTISASGAGGAGTGSGEVIRSDGYILTNNHVIAPAASGGTLNVLFSDGKAAAATLVGRDALTDIAVIKVDETGRPAVTIGDSNTLEVGQPVVALGAPLGLSSTVTSGIVSALGRTIHVPGENQQNALLLNAIQTDASINPGNSGGALVNCAGQFVGVPSAGASVPSASGEAGGGSIGLGFAIPSDLAIREANEIISTGRVSRAYLGIQATAITPDVASANSVAPGLYVTAVDPAGPGNAAGLRVGDIITTIDGHPAQSSDQLALLTLTKNPGDKVEIGYERNGQASTTTLTLANQP